jgi:protease-4
MSELESNAKVGVVRRFFTMVWRWVGYIRLLMLNLFFLVMVGIVVTAIYNHESFDVPEKAALVFAPSGEVVEQRSFIDPITKLLDPDSLDAQTSQRELVNAIKAATKDQRIGVLALRLDRLSSIGLTKTAEIGEYITEFKATGRKVIAYGSNYNQQQYLLASFADEIYVHPMGGVLVNGFGVYRSYVKDALDKLNIDFHLFRVGKYKSAMEPYIRSDMSAESKVSAQQWLDVLWGQYTGLVTANRELPVASLNHYANNIDEVMATVKGDIALAALEYGLIDGLKTKEEFIDYIADISGYDEDQLYNRVGYRQYVASMEGPLEKLGSAQPGSVGVVVVEGAIVDGSRPAGVAGGDTIAGLIRQARLNENIEALVLRVSTGGGSAFASEIIREQLALTQQAGKPVVVSMGSVAASGGYWIAAGADEVWASASTLTGSIGIFAAVPTIDRALAKLGIYNDGVGTTKVADALYITRPINETAAKAFQLNIERGYQRFINLVADGREMTVEAVDEIAQGRVWIGVDAAKIGLVDNLGNLEQAIASAATLAKLEGEPKVYWLKDDAWAGMSLFDQLLGGLQAKAFSIQGLKEIVMPFSQLVDMNDPANIYMVCNECGTL